MCSTLTDVCFTQCVLCRWANTPVTITGEWQRLCSRACEKPLTVTTSDWGIFRMYLNLAPAVRAFELLHGLLEGQSVMCSA